MLTACWEQRDWRGNNSLLPKLRLVRIWSKGALLFKGWASWEAKTKTKPNFLIFFSPFEPQILVRRVAGDGIEGDVFTTHVSNSCIVRSGDQRRDSLRRWLCPSGLLNRLPGKLRGQENPSHPCAASRCSPCSSSLLSRQTAGLKPRRSARRATRGVVKCPTALLAPVYRWATVVLLNKPAISKLL